MYKDVWFHKGWQLWLIFSYLNGFAFEFLLLPNFDAFKIRAFNFKWSFYLCLCSLCFQCNKMIACLAYLFGFELMTPKPENCHLSWYHITLLEWMPNDEHNVCKFHFVHSTRRTHTHTNTHEIQLHWNCLGKSFDDTRKDHGV